MSCRFFSQHFAAISIDISLFLSHAFVRQIALFSSVAAMVTEAVGQLPAEQENNNIVLHSQLRREREFNFLYTFLFRGQGSVRIL